MSGLKMTGKQRTITHPKSEYRRKPGVKTDLPDDATP